MTLSRAWGRKLSVASLTALLVPGAIVSALVLLVMAGGFGGLGSLGQAFNGPPLPTGAALASARTPRHHAAPPAARALSIAPGSAATRPQAGVTPSSSAGSGPLPPAVPGSGNRGPGSAQGAPAPQGSGAGIGHPAGQSSPPAGSRPRGTIADQAVSAASAISKQLPEPAGPAATQALQTAGATADRILPPGAGRPAP